MTDNPADFFQTLRVSIRDFLEGEGKGQPWADYLLLVPEFFYLLCGLSLDKDVDPIDKAILSRAVVYFVSPMDLMPEALLGPIGYLDDLVVAAWVINQVIHKLDAQIIGRYWSGPTDARQTIHQVLSVAEDMLGSQIWGQIQAMF